MREERGTIRGDLHVKDAVVLIGRVTGNVTVSAGGTLDLGGRVSGDLMIEAGGTVRLTGTVAGDVVNAGGQLNVLGEILGRLYRVGGATHVEPTAVVYGRRGGEQPPAVA